MGQAYRNRKGPGQRRMVTNLFLRILVAPHTTQISVARANDETLSFPRSSFPNSRRSSFPNSHLGTQSLLKFYFLLAIGRAPLPHRPNRSEPRAKKRRPKNYQLLNKPRRQFKEIPHRSKYVKSAYVSAILYCPRNSHTHPVEASCRRLMTHAQGCRVYDLHAGCR